MQVPRQCLKTRFFRPTWRGEDTLGADVVKMQGWWPKSPDRRARRATIMVLLAVLAVVCASCSAFDAESRVLESLQTRGYKGIFIRLQASTDPSLADVSVTYMAGPSGVFATDERGIAQVVWTTLPYRFRRLAVAHVSVFCRVPSCVTSAEDVRTYDSLEADFGPRPA